MNQRAALILINDEKLNQDSLYTLVTSDYLIEGNDGMQTLKAYKNAKCSSKSLRNVFIEHIKEITSKGKPIQANLDGRIYYVEE